MAAFTPQERQRLPRWAADKIAALEREAEEARAFVSIWQGNHPTSRIEIQPQTGIGNPKLFSPDDTTIRFFLGDREAREDWLEICLPYHFRTKSRYPRAVLLRASGRVAVFQDASNSAIITLADLAPQLVQDGMT